MKHIAFIAIILKCGFSFSQEKDSVQAIDSNYRSSLKGWVSNNFVFSLEYGISNYQIGGLNHYLETTIGSSFTNNLGGVGASLSNIITTNRRFTVDSHLDYHFFHSTPIVIEQNDSARYYLQGFHIGLDACQDLFRKQKNVDFLVGFGFNAGRFVFGNWDLTVENKANRKNRYTNPFFAPKLSLEPRIILFKHLSISVRAEYQFDITSQNWRFKNDDLDPIGSTAATGYNLRLSLGWRF